MYLCVYVCMYVCMHQCMYIYIWILPNMHYNIDDLLTFSNNGLQCIGSASALKFID